MIKISFLAVLLSIPLNADSQVIVVNVSFGSLINFIEHLVVHI